MRPIVARDVMTPEVLSIGESATLPELANFLLGNEISGAVVVNAEGEPVGVVSLSDLAESSTPSGDSLDSQVAAFLTEDWRGTFDESDVREIRVEDEAAQVGDIMTAEIVSIEADARMPLKHAARRMGPFVKHAAYVGGHIAIEQVLQETA